MGFRQKVSCFLFVINNLLFACSTTPPPIDRSSLPECYCGRPVNSEETCAVWPIAQSSKAASPLIHTANSTNCDANACREHFADKCQTIRLWPHSEKHAKWQVQELCYCDLVWIDLGQGPEIACGAWSASQPWLIEYFSTEQCQPQTCSQAPFSLAAQICPKGFETFYVDGQHPPAASSSR